MKALQLPSGSLQRGKTVIYGIQAVAVCIAWMLTIAVLTKSGTTGSATKFYFFLTWISIPAFVYIAAVPHFARTKRFANPYVIAVVDILYSILWLAALAAVAFWTNQGIEDKSKGCARFKYGSESKCMCSMVSVILGIIVFGLFLIASALSIYSALYYRKTGSMPNTRPSISQPVFTENQTKLGLASTVQNDEEANVETSHLQQTQQRQGLAPIRTNSEDEAHPGRPLSWGQIPLTAPPTYDQSANQSPNPNASLTRQDSSYSPQAVGMAYTHTHTTAPRPQQLNLFHIGNPFTEDPRTESNASNARYAPYDNRPEMRGPLPGPASMHVGGHHSAFHTPLPPHTPLPLSMNGERLGNSWRDDRALGRGGDGYGGRLVFPGSPENRQGII